MLYATIMELYIYIYIHIISIFYTIMFPWKFDLDIAGQTQSGHEATVTTHTAAAGEGEPKGTRGTPKATVSDSGRVCRFFGSFGFSHGMHIHQKRGIYQDIFLIFVGYLNIFEPDPKHAVLCFLIPDDIAFTFFDFCQGRSYRGVAYICICIYVCTYAYIYIYICIF